MKMRKFLYLALAAMTLTLAACGGNEPVVNLVADNGAMPGVFSVANGKKVRFSQGNLQYQASPEKTWRFATRQWEVLSENNKYISSNYTGWIDLFGWGTGDEPTKHTTDADYKVWKEWGKNNITTDPEQKYEWYTLNADDWKILMNRTDKWGTGTVNGIVGLILLPDDWENPEGAPLFKSEFQANSFTHKSDSYGEYYEKRDANYNFFLNNKYAGKTWDRMEENGAIFLPLGGSRSGISCNETMGCYWSQTKYSAELAYALQFDYNTGIFPKMLSTSASGFSVRLVTAAE